MLNLMGARISGADSSTLEIDGVEALKPIVYSTIPDRIEAGTFLLAGAITGGDVMVRGARADHMNALLDKMIQAGCDIEVLPDGVRVRAGQPHPARPPSAPCPTPASRPTCRRSSWPCSAWPRASRWSPRGSIPSASSTWPN